MGHLPRHARALVALWSGVPDAAHQTQARRLASAHFAVGALFLAASAPSLETDRHDVVYQTARPAGSSAGGCGRCWRRPERCRLRRRRARPRAA